MELSIVMITFNKAIELPLILKALFLQKDTVENWELIIIDDGSTDNSVIEIEQYTDRLNIKLYTLEHSGNRNHARNFGLKKCTGRRIVVMDGDICPYNTFLAAHNSFGDDDVIVIGERQHLFGPLTDAQRSVFLEGNNIQGLQTLPLLSDERRPYFADTPVDMQHNMWRFVYSHNFSFPQKALHTAGYFDEEMSSWGADDLELGFRFVKNNFSVSFSINSGGVHLPHKISRTSHYEHNLEIFYKKHKEPEVELLFVEWQLSPVECNKAYTNCSRSTVTLAVDALENAASMQLTQENTILNSISSKKEMNFDTLFGIGIYTKDIIRKYEHAILSPLLIKMGLDIFVIIVENMEHIADSVFIYDPARSIEKELLLITTCDSRRQFRYTNGYWLFRRNAASRTNNIFFLLKSSQDLSNANAIHCALIDNLNTIGSTTSALAKAIDLSTTNNPTTAQFYKSAIFPSKILPDSRHTYVFIEPESLHHKGMFNNAKTVFWDLFWFEDYHYLAKHYDIIILDAEDKVTTMKQITQTTKTVDYIEPFFDSNYFFPVNRQKNKTFTLCIIQNNFYEFIKTLDVLGRLSDLANITVTIYSNNLEWVIKNSPYLNSSLNHKIETWINSFTSIQYGHFQILKERFKVHSDNKRVVFHQTTLSLEKTAHILQQSDCCICNEPHMVIQALACGTAVIAPERFSHYSFTKHENCHLIPSWPSSGYVSDVDLKPLDGYSELKEFEINDCYHIDDVLQVLHKCVINWNKGVPADTSRELLRKYTVETAAAKISYILDS